MQNVKARGRYTLLKYSLVLKYLTLGAKISDEPHSPLISLYGFYLCVCVCAREREREREREIVRCVSSFMNFRVCHRCFSSVLNIRVCLAQLITYLITNLITNLCLLDGRSKYSKIKKSSNAFNAREDHDPLLLLLVVQNSKC